MAISTTAYPLGPLGNYRLFLHVHTTPGAQTANDITTGAAYVMCAVGNPAGAPDPDESDFSLRITPNTSDHSTESNGHYCLECESDLTCYVLVLTSG